MKHRKAILRTLVVTSFAFALTLGAQADDSPVNERKDFRKLLQKVSLMAQKKPLQCIETAYQQPARKVSYKIKLREEPQYQDAFFVVFEPAAQARVWSTLIAYEGKRGFVMGTLSVQPDDTQVVYSHAFRGFLTDVTEVVTEHDQIKELRFFKFGTGEHPLHELHCLTN